MINISLSTIFLFFFVLPIACYLPNSLHSAVHCWIQTHHIHASFHRGHHLHRYSHSDIESSALSVSWLYCYSCCAVSFSACPKYPWSSGVSMGYLRYHPVYVSYLISNSTTTVTTRIPTFITITPIIAPTAIIPKGTIIALLLAVSHYWDDSILML